MAKQIYPYQETDNLIRNWLGVAAEVEDKPARRSPGRGGGRRNGKVTWGKKTTQLPRLTPAQVLANKPFINKVKQVAANLGVKPEYLMGIMEIESAGTFSPEVVNDLGFTGLIQFGYDAANGLGTTREALSKMTDVQQMDYVERYFRKNGVKRNSPPSALYTSVFAPKFINESDNFEIASYKFRVRPWEQNPKLHDPSHPTKAITKSYLGKLVKNHAANYVGM